MAELDGQTAGFAAFTQDELAWLYVDPALARRGVGRALVEHALGEMGRPVSIEVLAGNTPALALYEGCGFHPTQTLSGRMPGNEAFAVTVHVLELGPMRGWETSAPHVPTINSILKAKGEVHMKEQLANIRAEALAAFDGAQDSAQLDELRVKYLGKKGELTAVLKMMGKLSPSARPAMGQLANDVRARPGRRPGGAFQGTGGAGPGGAAGGRGGGRDHPRQGRAPGPPSPMYIALDEIKEVFIGMGFTVLDAPRSSWRS